MIEGEIGRIGKLAAGGVAAIGNFDGVHLGHQALIGRAAELAEASGRTAVVVSFWPHPLAVIDPPRAPRTLTTPAQRFRLIEPLGPAALIWIPFTTSVAQLPPEGFVDRFLVAGMGIGTVAVGHDFRFGFSRRGDAGTLERLGAAHGFDVVVLPAVTVGAERVSSSLVRHELEAGRIDHATRLLGHPYSLTGTVVSGSGRGRELGFPTANLRPEQGVVPAEGVYAAWVELAGESRPGVVNIGRRPTFGGGDLLIEAHLPGWSGNAVGKAMELRFVARIRPERKFPSSQALTAQIARDVGRLDGLLARHRR